jgi:hypothetical protein
LVEANETGRVGVSKAEIEVNNVLGVYFDVF